MLQRLPYSAFERDAFIRTAEVALSVSTSRHLFMWLRLHLRRFVPHELAICHLPSSLSGQAPTHVFHSVPMAEDLLQDLARTGPRFWNALRDVWLAAGRQPVHVRLDQLLPSPEVDGLRQEGVDRLLIHGVDASACLRPEAMFAFGLAESTANEDAACAGLALWMPYLHACAVKALSAPAVGSAAIKDRTSDRLAPTAIAGPLTAREVQVLMAVRHAKRTTEIADQLGISPLTVKNHMRKIMDKLGVRSRVHAVAEAMTRQIIS